MSQKTQSTSVPLCIQKVEAGNCLYTITLVYHCRMMYSSIARSFINFSNNVKFVFGEALWEWKSRCYFWPLFEGINGYISFVKVFLCYYCKCPFRALYMRLWGIFLERTWYTEKMQLEFFSFNIHFRQHIFYECIYGSKLFKLFSL